MWSLADKKALAEARKIAYEKFLCTGISVIGYICPSGRHHGSYSSDVEKEFRRQIEKVFKENQ